MWGSKDVRVTTINISADIALLTGHERRTKRSFIKLNKQLLLQIINVKVDFLKVTSSTAINLQFEKSGKFPIKRIGLLKRVRLFNEIRDLTITKHTVDTEKMYTYIFKNPDSKVRKNAQFQIRLTKKISSLKKINDFTVIKHAGNIGKNTFLKRQISVPSSRSWLRFPSLKKLK